MEYKHSTVVDPSTYDDFGLCGALPLRISKYGNLADKGCQRAQEDWIRFVGKISDFTGCRCARFNAISAGVPECHPERMEMVTYANEFAFLQDGACKLAKCVIDDTK